MLIQKERYEPVYSAALLQNESLDELFWKFNVDQPAYFTGHSLNVSDIIVLYKENAEQSFYMDDKGFVEVPEL